MRKLEDARLGYLVLALLSVPRLRKEVKEVTSNQSLDLVASPTKLERALSIITQPMK